MDKKNKHLDQISKANPFQVPEGYFEGLTGQIMSNLPERIEEEVPVVTLWDRVKPWVYMAAMFVGIALMVKVFVNTSTPTTETLYLTSQVEIEEFYDYYEEQVVKSLYHETYNSEEFDYSEDNNQ